MTYKEFIENIVKEVGKKMGDNYSVTSTEVLKNNDIRLTGIVINKEEIDISPTIYLEEPYRQYQDGVPLQEIRDEIIKLYEKHVLDINLDMEFFRDFSEVKERIFYKLINHDKNKELLMKVPHFKWNDLAIVFYYAMNEVTFRKASILLYNNHLDMWGKSAMEIYQTAQRNMIQSMPELLMPMHKVMEELTGIEMEETKHSLYVLTNREKIYGASAMLYSEKIKELANELETDLLILPSSIHEVLLLPDEGEQEYDSFRRMVNEVNITQVDPEEILSFNLYRYDRKKEEIEEITA